MNIARLLATRVLPPVATVIVALLAWQLFVRAADVKPYLLPAPTEVAEVLAKDARSLMRSAELTFIAALAGFGIASVLGVVVGSLLSTSRWLERGVYPLTLLFQMVPLVAIAPILAIWLGNGMPAVIAASAVVSIFPVIANTVGGLRTVDPLLAEMFALYRATRWRHWSRLGLPSAVPSIMTGLRIAAGLATIGAIVGEFVAGFGGDDSPLGIVIMTSMKDFKTAKVFAAVALASLVGFALFGVVSAFARLVARRYDPAT